MRPPALFAMVGEARRRRNGRAAGRLCHRPGQSAAAGTRAGGQSYALTAVFSDALNLPAKAKVKLYGADIGEVESIRAQTSPRW